MFRDFFRKACRRVFLGLSCRGSHGLSCRGSHGPIPPTYGCKTKKMELDPYKNPFFTDPIPENAILNRTFHDVIRLKDRKICF